MQIHMVIDDPNWAFGQIARGLGAAVARRGHGFTHAIPVEPVPSDVDAVLVGFVGLLPAVEDVPDDKIFVGLMSHWELDSLTFRGNVERLRRVAGVYAGCASIAARATTIIGRPVYCIEGGIDTDLYRPRPPLPRPADRPLVAGWSGNAGMECKRFDRAIAACEAAGWELDAVGRGGGLNPITPEEMPSWLGELDVYLCTSLSDTGPSGPLEAAACGVPTISTGCGFMPQFILHGKTGWVRNTHDQMVDQLKAIAAIPNIAAACGQRARLHVERHWSWDKRCVPYLAMLEGRWDDDRKLWRPQGATSMDRALVIHDWREIRSDPATAEKEAGQMFVGVPSPDHLDALITREERDLLRKARGMFAPNRALARAAADHFGRPVAVKEGDSAIEWSLPDLSGLEWSLPDLSGIEVVEPDPRPLAAVVLMRTMDVEDAATESALWRLVNKKGRLRWTLSPSPPLASVDWARSKALSDALQWTDAAVFVMQDGDMGVDLDDYEHLAIRALELHDGIGGILGSMLCKRGGGGMCGIVNLPAHFAKEEGSLTVDLYSDQQAELTAHEYNGAALTAYPRAVLERLTTVLPWVVPHGTPPDNPDACREHGFWPFFLPELRAADLAWNPGNDAGTAVYMTEDRAFCDFARGVQPVIAPPPDERRREYPIEHVWISLKPRVGHWGAYRWLPHMAFARREK